MRNKFPLNIHSEMSVNSQGVSLRTKNYLIIGFLFGLTLLITWIFYKLLRDTSFSILSGVVGFIVGVIVSVFIYQYIIINSRTEDFEDSKKNKIYKFFKFSISSDLDKKYIDGIECMRYTSGQYLIALSLSIGNVSEFGEQVSEEFLDMVFKIVHQEKYKIKIYTVNDTWDNSELHIKLLDRLSKITDKKLRNTLSLIDEFQSKEVFIKSSVPRIIITFQVGKIKVDSLQPIIDYVKGWCVNSKKLSSFREVLWLSNKQLIDINCQYLGIKMIDASFSSKNESVPIDIRKLIRVNSSSNSSYSHDKSHIDVDTNITYIRKSSLSNKKNDKR